MGCFLIEIREEERRILEKAGYFQSITVGVAPIVVVIASVVTFSVHMTLGFDLTAAQVRTVRDVLCRARVSSCYVIWDCYQELSISFIQITESRSGTVPYTGVM